MQKKQSKAGRTSKQFMVSCCGEEHTIELSSSKKLSMTHHDAEEEETIRLLGDEPASCYRWTEALRINPGDVLCFAANNDHYDMARLALELGASPSCHKDLPLRLAAHEGHHLIIKLLLDNGADLNIHNNRPLKLAAINGKLDAIVLLIEHGANIDAVHAGIIQLAHKRGHHSAVNYLLTHGVDRSLLHRKYLNPVIRAYEEHVQLASRACPEVLELLIGNN